ncbi:alternate-type signal peptide domain-containing protein [Prescottella equi]|uniref:alternate-type signal peptide domain-containing protein n=1 Tax=Rhodococcus hoagii TaxID=43767 RepID=UPI0007CD4329|nr:alternate-type signal peptide domain-containing protein [Prescottella equi]MBM4555809.1 alternate-type signal peptide domain-containing protein [Prescottella equi]UNQ36002.1 alternate-type signal peptide domain-containing protein [Prescottella equi]
MNKKTKGAIAAGAAAVLLAGGAGTMAAWTSSQSVSGADIKSGHLTVTQKSGTTAGWAWSTPGKTGTFDPTTQTLVPGDSVTYTGTYVLGIEGTNLTADLTVGTLSGGTLPAGLTFSTTGSTADLTGLTEEADGDEVTVTGTLTFAGTATGSMNQTIDISDVAVTLKQTAPAAATP